MAKTKQEIRRQWYERHADEQKARAAAHREQHKVKARALVDAAKSVPCTDCGHSYSPFVMDLDHVRGEKVMEISRMATIGFSLEKLRAEIAKCEVVCANCHRTRTHRPT